MKVTVEKLPNCQASVHVEVPGETRKAARDRIVRNYIREAALPGFRKGKAPSSVVERKFGAEIEREVTDKLFNDGLNAAVEQEKLRVLNVTEFNPDKDNSDAKYAFSLKVTLAPEVTLPDYKGLSITVPKAEVTDADVDKVLEGQRERLADLSPVTRPAQENDFLSIDYTATLDGTPVTEILPEAQHFIGQSSGYMVKANADNFLPGFCTQLIGMNTGETREVKVTFPEETRMEELAGKEVVYSVTLKEVNEARLPELDDALAERLFPGKKLEELRAIIRSSLENQTAQKDMERKRIAAMIALRDKVEFELPPSIVHDATQHRVNQLVQMNLERGLTKDAIEESEQDIINAANEQAKVDVKDEYILLEIVDRENIQVTQDDMVRRVTYIAQSSNTTVDRVVKAMKKNDGFKSLRHSIILGKALDVLVQHANITYDGTAGPDDAGATEAA